MLCWWCFYHTSLWWIPWIVSIKYQSQMPGWCWNVSWHVCSHKEMKLSSILYLNHSHYLLLWGNCNHFYCILVWIGPLIICSVDVSGRRKMRSFFNGIVRLQVCTTLSSISFYFCFCKGFFLLSMLLLPAMPLVCQNTFVPIAVTSFCPDCPSPKIQGSGRSLPRSCTSRMDKTSVIQTSRNIYQR